MWVSCFLTFMATCTPHKGTRELAAYGMVILQLAKKHRGNSWLLYDRLFRQHWAVGTETQWAYINPSLLAATVLSHPAEGPSCSCSLCLSADHTKEDCTLSSLKVMRGSGGQSSITRLSMPPSPTSPQYAKPIYQWLVKNLPPVQQWFFAAIQHANMSMCALGARS